MPKRFRSDIEKEYLIEAIDAFNRRLLVISPDHKILAANHTAMLDHPEGIVGKPAMK
ncbi:MAG: hypothetical protein R2874_11975 [Desulfobacterales bacterium]